MKALEKECPEKWLESWLARRLPEQGNLWVQSGVLASSMHRDLCFLSRRGLLRLEEASAVTARLRWLQNESSFYHSSLDRGENLAAMWLKLPQINLEAVTTLSRLANGKGQRFNQACDGVKEPWLKHLRALDQG